jgi:hypothetical protein
MLNKWQLWRPRRKWKDKMMEGTKKSKERGIFMEGHKSTGKNLV